MLVFILTEIGSIQQVVYWKMNNFNVYEYYKIAMYSAYCILQTTKHILI